MTATHVEVEARRPLHPDTVAAPTRARIARALFLRAARLLPAGSLTVVLPDGLKAVAGRPGAPTMTVHREDFFHRLGAHGRIGFGEAYMAGDWSADDLRGRWPRSPPRSTASPRRRFAGSDACSTGACPPTRRTR